MTASRRILRNFKPALSHPLSQHDQHPECKLNKPYHDIPRKRGFIPPLIDLILNGGAEKLHEHCDKRHKCLGPIFREKLGNNELVFIADTDMIRTVIANEGSQPHHNVPEAWLLYNQVKKIDRGLFFQIGEPWLKMRRAFNKVLLANPSKITRFSDELSKLNLDLFDSWTKESLGHSKSNIEISDVKSSLCNWSIEATGLMLFGQRMGCVPSSKLESKNSSRAEELVSSVAKMFQQTSVFQLIPPKLAQKFNLESWKKFERASGTMINIANAYAAEYIEKAKLNDSKSSIVRDLLDLRVLNDDEISRTMVDLIIAAADTTSNSLQWILYALAKYPETQTKVLDEIRISSKSASPAKSCMKSPYRHAFVKEVMRLYPTAPFLARTLDHSISLGGYDIPKGKQIVFSLYSTSRDERYFSKALSFLPERWLRNSDDALNSKRSAYATLPFGIGSRMCIGRRMADLEMDLLIAALVENYEISLLHPEKEVSIKLKMILGPQEPISLKLKSRRA